MSTREVAVASMSDRYSAELVLARLRDAGIPARTTSGVEPSWTTGSPTSVMPVEVRVTEDRAAEAKALLESDEDAGGYSLSWRATSIMKTVAPPKVTSTGYGM